jgi:hypothetical protein
LIELNIRYRCRLPWKITKKNLELQHFPQTLTHITTMLRFEFHFFTSTNICDSTNRKNNLSSSSTRKANKGKQELTEEQKQEIREAFDLFDTDGNGKENSRFHDLKFILMNYWSNITF